MLGEAALPWGPPARFLFAFASLALAAIFRDLPPATLAAFLIPETKSRLDSAPDPLHTYNRIRIRGRLWVIRLAWTQLRQERLVRRARWLVLVESLVILALLVWVSL